MSIPYIVLICIAVFLFVFLILRSSPRIKRVSLKFFKIFEGEIETHDIPNKKDILEKKELKNSSTIDAINSSEVEKESFAILNEVYATLNSSFVKGGIKNKGTLESNNSSISD